MIAVLLQCTPPHHTTPFHRVCFRLLSCHNWIWWFFFFENFQTHTWTRTLCACSIIHAAKLWWKNFVWKSVGTGTVTYHFSLSYFFYSLSCSTLVSLTSCMVTPHHTTPHVRLLVICVLASHNEMVCTIWKLFMHVLAEKSEKKGARAQNTCKNKRCLCSLSLSAYSERKTLTYTDQTYHFHTMLAKDEIITRIVERWANAKCSGRQKTHTQREK